MNFLLKEDISGKLKFASLSGQTAQKLLKDNDNSSIIFLINGNELRKSDAVFALIKYMHPIWNVLKLFKIFPRNFIDSIYDLVSRNRYKWFGQKDYCRVPTPQEKERFLD